MEKIKGVIKLTVGSWSVSFIVMVAPSKVLIMDLQGLPRGSSHNPRPELNRIFEAINN
jgi:predicted P-loop ATPase/GTPase